VALASSLATAADRDELASFVCWDRNPNEPWVEEAQNFVRAWVLSKTQHCLISRDEAPNSVLTPGFESRAIMSPRADSNHLAVMKRRRRGRRTAAPEPREGLKTVPGTPLRCGFHNSCSMAGQKPFLVSGRTSDLSRLSDLQAVTRFVETPPLSGRPSPRTNSQLQRVEPVYAEAVVFCRSRS
jgi:hypothetical protein